MAEQANPTGEPGTNPDGSSEEPVTPTDTNPKGSGEEEPKGPTDGERKLQSERDKLRARLDNLEGFAAEQMREKIATTFLQENKDKFPDVDVDDFALAESEEQLEELAKKAQDKADRIRNKALADVHNVPDDSLTEDQAEKELNELEKKPNRHSFQDFLRIRQRTRR